MRIRISFRREVCLLVFALALASPGSADAGAVPLVETTGSMHARYYSANLGRFLSVDPVGGTVDSSQSWNRYSYVLNNPLKFTDPTGEMVDATSTMSRGAFGDPLPATPAKTPEQRAIAAIALYPLFALSAVPLVSLAPGAAPGVALGGALGFATSTTTTLGSDAPIDQKIDAIAAGTALGALTGPMKIGPVRGAVSSIVARNTADQLTGQGATPAGEVAREGLNGMVSGAVGSMAPNPLAQAATAAGTKLLFDVGTTAFDGTSGGGQTRVMSKEDLESAYVDFFGGSR